MTHQVSAIKNREQGIRRPGGAAAALLTAIRNDPKNVIAALNADLLPIEGGRLTLKAFPTSAMGRLSTIQDGLKIVPWPRVYADLRTIGVRGEEAAEHLRELMRAR